MQLNLNLGWQPDNPIGVDISDLSFKLIQLSRKGVNLDVTASTDVLLPPGLVKQDIITNDEAFVTFVKNIINNKSLHRGKVSGRSVVASVPESKAYVRVINLPNLLPKELASAVALEAEQYIPLPIDQVELDWELVGESAQGVKVLITASPKDYVNKLVNLLTRAGFILQALEAESAAIVRCLLPQTGDQPGTLIVDMDATRTSLIIHANKSIQFTSSIPIAGNALTESLAQKLNMSKDEAEHLKRLRGVPLHKAEGEKIPPEDAKVLGDIIQALDPVLTNIFDEMKNAIKFHEEHSGGQESINSQISQIIMCGGTSKLPNLYDYIEAKIAADPYFSARKVKVALGNPWTNVVQLGQPPFSTREALSYTTALGLALRNYV